MKVNLRTYIELIGIASLVASLIFVGIQLILDRRVSLGNAYQARAESRMENLRMYVSNENLIRDSVERIEAGARPFYYTESIRLEGEKTGYSLEHIIRYSLLQQINMVSFDNIYYQRSLGFLEESYWDAATESLEQTKIFNPLVWEIYLNAAVNTDFIEYLENF